MTALYTCAYRAAPDQQPYIMLCQLERVFFGKLKVGNANINIARNITFSAFVESDCKVSEGITIKIRPAHISRTL